MATYFENEEKSMSNQALNQPTFSKQKPLFYKPFYEPL